MKDAIVTETEADQDHAALTTSVVGRRCARWHLQGWKAGAASAAVVATITLIINCVAVAWLRAHPNEDGTLVELFRGNCDKVENMHVASHFLIVSFAVLSQLQSS